MTQSKSSVKTPTSFAAWMKTCQGCSQIEYNLLSAFRGKVESNGLWKKCSSMGKSKQYIQFYFPVFASRTQPYWDALDKSLKSALASLPYKSLAKTCIVTTAISLHEHNAESTNVAL